MKNSLQVYFTRASFAAMLLSVGARVAPAQTSGTLTATATTYNYSTAPWVITSGTGTYPDGGGAATFGPITGATPGTVATLSTVTIDVSPTLSQINVNSPFYYNLAAGTGTSIIAANTGLTINSQTAQNIFNNIGAVSIPVGFAILSPISGGGTAGVTKTGTGNFYLAGTNTFTGGLHVDGGLVNLAGGDASLGATGAGNGLSFNGGSLLFSLATTVARDIFLDTGGATLYTAASSATTLSGVISGTGSLTNIGFGSTVLSLTGISTYTGATTTRASNVFTTLSGTGSITMSSSYDLMGTFTLDNSGTNGSNRLSDTAAVTLRGINFVDTGNAGATSSETIGAVTGAGSFNTLLVTPGTGQANSLTMASLARQNNSTFAFRGTGLGGTPGALVANIYATTAPTLVGGGGSAGSTGISIVPYAIGNSTTSVAFTAAGLINSSFVTYDVNGFRPLATAEYASAFGVNNTDNVRITAATVVPGTGVTANAVLLAPATAAASALSGGPINVTSGAFLYSPSANVTGTVSAAFNFGTAEGVITNTSLLTMSGVLSGSNGLTLTTTYAPTNNYTPNLSLTGANTYTGNTTINGGAVGFSGTVTTGTNGAFGTNGTVILDGGRILASLVPTASTTFNANISSIGFGSNYISPSTSGFTSTFNGGITLSNNLFLEGYINAAASALNFNGVISGPATLTDIAYTYGVFNGNNTYSGGTILAGTTVGNASTFYAGTDTAFGTGPIIFNGTSALAGVGTTARTLANALVLNAATDTITGTAPLNFTGPVNLNGSSNGAGVVAITNTALTTFSGVVSSGSFTKTGTGAVALNSTTGNTFTGGFVNTGVAATASAIYANNSSGSAFGTGAVSIGAGSATVFSTLAGSFTTSGATSIGGRLSPGNTPANLTPATAGVGAIGTVNFGGSLILSSPTTSSLYLEIGGSPGSGLADKINVTGALTLNGTVNLATTNGYTLQFGDTYDLADWGSITVGTVTYNSASATFAAATPSLYFDTSRFLIDGTVTVVPEPASVLGGAFTVGLLGLGLRRRLRARA